MKILTDHQIFSLQDYGGISRYFTELYIQKSIDYELFIEFSNNFYLQKIQRVKPFFSNHRFPLKRASLYLANHLKTTLHVKPNRYSIYHPTYYDPSLAFLWQNLPTVVSVYDMIHEKFPSFFPKHDPTRFQKKLLLSKASRIISISHSTKKDLCEIYGIKESKVDVIHLAVQNRETSNSRKDSLISPKKYILFVGTRGGYKNFNRFIKAAAPILHKKQDLIVFCVGGGAFTEKENLLLKSLSLIHRVTQKDVREDHLFRYYQQALLMVYPSLYEGFGLPLLEAFQAGCPVISSNSSSLREVGGSAPLYFNPLSSSAIQKSIIKCIENNDVRNNLALAGQKQLKKFSWESTANQTKETYLRTIEEVQSS